MALLNYYPREILTPANQFRSFKLFANRINIIDGISKAESDVINKIAEDSEESAKETETVWCCAISLPNELNDSQSHTWSTTEGMVARGFRKFSNTAVRGIGDTSGMKNQNSGIGKARRTIGLANPNEAAKVVKEAAHMLGKRQPIVNPGYWQEYSGSQPRSFSFSWDMIPESAEEARQIIEIIKRLKRYSAPQETAMGLGLLSPFTFDIEIGNPKLNELIKLETVVINNMDVQYAAEGALQFLPDGTPKHIRLSLQFTELKSRTAHDYGEPQNEETGAN